VTLNSILRGIIALSLGTALSAAASSDVHTLAQAVDGHYNHLRSLQADFTETYRGNGTNRTESGVLWLKKPGLEKPGKMRWEYRSMQGKDYAKLFLSDGKDAWFYVPGDRQARRAPVKQLDDLRSPLSLLLGKTKLEKELQGLSLAPDIVPIESGDVVLRGVPKNMQDRMSQILLEITPTNQITRIVIEEVDGATTEYRFSGQKENVEINDERFRFIPPAGVEVISGEFEQ
jgi:outer membrane lipoprotein carrier protein